MRPANPASDKLLRLCLRMRVILVLAQLAEQFQTLQMLALRPVERVQEQHFLPRLHRIPVSDPSRDRAHDPETAGPAGTGPALA